MILAIDPGSQKTGIAFVQETGDVYEKEIIGEEDLERILRQGLELGIRAVVMGDGTNHRHWETIVRSFLQREHSEIVFSLVNERYTTEMGEKWYKRDHRPKGWKRLIPEGMRTPPEPVDDYVAWVIGCIYLGLVSEEAVGHFKV